MQIVYDKHSEEYGVLKKKPFKDMLVDITKSLKKIIFFIPKKK